MHDPITDPDSELSRTRAVRIPPRQPRWVLVTIICAIALGVVLSVVWMQTGMPIEEARPGIDREVEPTSGAHPIDERVPGATSGPTGSNDYNYVDLTIPVKRGDMIAYLDRQPLYVVDPTPVEMRDTEMIIEGRANQDSESDAPKYNLYVPAATATRQADASARFYYLKVGPNQYLKVTLITNASTNQ